MEIDTRFRNFINTFQRAFIRITVFVLILAIAGTVYQTAATESDQSKYPPPGNLIDVDGFKMHIHCEGEGSPTVILEAASGGTSVNWGWIQPEVQKETRVCVYDRAGFGWSESDPESLTLARTVRNLHTLLVNANIEGPYVMVGHSFGGALTELYVHTYPDEVVGLVLVDATPVDLFVRIHPWSKAIERKIGLFRVLEPLSSFGLFALSPESIPNRGFPKEALLQYQAISSATDYYKITIAENEMFENNLTEIKSAHISSFGDLPLIVLSRGTWEAMPGFTEAENQQALLAWNEMQSELLKLSTHSSQVVAERSEHFIQLQQPQLVIDAIQQTIQETKK